jgi:hypothetical protein
MRSTIKLHAHVTGAWDSDLLETAGKRLRVTEDSVRFDLHPFEIKTIALRLSR